MAAISQQGAPLPVIAALLAEAFAADPGMRYICQAKRAGYERRLANWFGATLRLQCDNQQPILTLHDHGEIVGSATLTNPATRLTSGSMARWVGGLLTQVGWVSLWRSMRYILRLEDYYPQQPHHRLEFIAVSPICQGSGYGRRLLADIHQLVADDEASTGLWPETTNPAKVGFYQHLGYALTDHVTMFAEVEAFMMFRPAASLRQPLPMTRKT
jgi:GNAT superfamily N-acetyltransferase